MNFLTELLAGGTGSLELILICCYVGILAACALAIYDKRVMGNFIRALYLYTEAFATYKNADK